MVSAIPNAEYRLDSCARAIRIISRADVAQSVEQLIRNQQVVSSNLTVGSITLAMKKTILLLAAIAIFSTLARAGEVPGIFPRSNPPQTLQVLERKQLSNPDWHLATIIQGMVNRAQPRIFMVESAREPGGLNIWLDYYEKEYGVQKLGTITLREAWEKYSGLFQGYALFAFEEPWTVDVADTYCAIHDCLPVTAEQEGLARKAGLKKMEDFRGRWQDAITATEWSYRELYPKCSPRIIASIMPEHHCLRDYAYAHKIFSFYLKAQGVEFFACQRLLRKLPQNIPVVGYIAKSMFQELIVEIMLAREDKFMVATDSVPNLSVHSGIPIRPLPSFNQWSNPPDIRNKLAVVFAITDGDNIYLQSEHYLRPDFWQSPDRGKVKVAWTVAPELYELAPGMMRYYYQTRTANDFFVPFSGAGYTYTSFYRDSNAFVSLSKEYMELTGLDLFWTIDPQFYFTGDRRTFKKFAQPWAEQNFVKGILIGYIPSGMGKYHDDIPGFPPVLYEKASYLITDPKTMADNIKAEALTVPARGKIILYGVNDWEVHYDDIMKTVGFLEARKDIIFISPQEAFALIEMWRNK